MGFLIGIYFLIGIVCAIASELVTVDPGEPTLRFLWLFVWPVCLFFWMANCLIDFCAGEIRDIRKEWIAHKRRQEGS